MGSQQARTLRDSIAAQEAAEAAMSPVFKEAQELLHNGATPAPAHWVPKKKLTVITRTVWIITAVVMMIYLMIELDIQARWKTTPASLPDDLEDLRRMVPDVRVKIAHMRNVLSAPRIASAPLVDTPVAVRLQGVVRGAPVDKRPVQGNVLAWLNVGLAGCTAGERAAAEHAQHQLCRMANSARSRQRHAEKNESGEDRALALLLRRCKARGITLPRSPLMPDGE